MNVLLSETKIPIKLASACCNMADMLCHTGIEICALTKDWTLGHMASWNQAPDIIHRRQPIRPLHQSGIIIHEAQSLMTDTSARSLTHLHRLSPATNSVIILPSPILQPSTMTWTQKTTGSNNCMSSVAALLATADLVYSDSSWIYQGGAHSPAPAWIPWESHIWCPGYTSWASSRKELWYVVSGSQMSIFSAHTL